MGTNFWEFSLYFPRELLCYFDALKTDLKHIFSGKENCVSISVQDEKYCFMIALPHEVYNKNILTIKEKIADIILVYYKPKVIINSINNFDVKTHDNVILIDILSSFDHQDDKNYIINHLSLCDILYLSSFVFFKLQALVNNWKETGDLINQNSLFMLDAKVKKELMQFLMDGIVSKIEKVKLTQNNSSIVFDAAIKVLPIYYSIFEYDNVLFSLINNFPKKIEIENYKSFDVNFLQNLYDIFGSRVQLLE